MIRVSPSGISLYIGVASKVSMVQKKRTLIQSNLWEVLRKHGVKRVSMTRMNGPL